MSDFVIPWIIAHQASLSITNSRSPPKPISIESVMSSSHLILCRTILLLSPIPPSIRVFSNESTLCMRWPKYWSFSFSISLSNEHPGLISFRIDWLDLLAVQGTLKSLLQHHSSKLSILRCSGFFTVQLPHPYKATGKTITLTRQTFVGKGKVYTQTHICIDTHTHTHIYISIWDWASSRSWWWTGKPEAWHDHGVTKSPTWLSDWTELT